MNDPIERGVFDVAVVGFGPTGAVLAALLGQAGLRCWVGDRSTEVYDKPRAISLDHEILRIFQQIGVVDKVLQHVEPFTPSEYFGADGRLIKRLTMVEPPYPLGYTPSNVFTQPPVEAALREHVASLPDRDCRARCRRDRGGAGCRRRELRRAQCRWADAHLARTPSGGVRRRPQPRPRGGRDRTRGPAVRRALARRRRARQRGRSRPAASHQRAVLQPGAARHHGDRARAITAAGRSR